MNRKPPEAFASWQDEESDWIQRGSHHNHFFDHASGQSVGLLRIAFQKAATVFCSREADVITQETLTSYIRLAMPDAVVTMIDRTGTMDHLKVVVVSDAFKGKNLLDRHRLIYQALDAPMKDGRIHALELTARTKDEN